MTTYFCLMVRGGRRGFRFGGDEALFFEDGINAAAYHHGEEIFRDGLRMKHFSGSAVFHGEIGKRDFGDLAFLEGGRNAFALQREQAEIDGIAEEEAVDRIGDEAGDADIAQRARRGPARAGAVIAAADDEIAARHFVDPARTVGGEHCRGLFLFAARVNIARQHQISVDVVAEFPDAPRDDRTHPKASEVKSPAWAMTPAIADAATVAGEAM